VALISRQVIRKNLFDGVLADIVGVGAYSPIRYRRQLLEYLTHLLGDAATLPMTVTTAPSAGVTATSEARVLGTPAAQSRKATDDFNLGADSWEFTFIQNGRPFRYAYSKEDQAFYYPDWHGQASVPAERNPVKGWTLNPARDAQGDQTLAIYLDRRVLSRIPKEFREVVFVDARIVVRLTSQPISVLLLRLLGQEPRQERGPAQLPGSSARLSLQAWIVPLLGRLGDVLAGSQPNNLLTKLKSQA